MCDDAKLKSLLMQKFGTAITMLLTETAEKHAGGLLAFCLRICCPSQRPEQLCVLLSLLLI